MDNRAGSHCSSVIREITKKFKENKKLQKNKTFNFLKKSKTKLEKQNSPNPTVFLGRWVSLRQW
jgi:hypothetical protein